MGFEIGPLKINFWLALVILAVIVVLVAILQGIRGNDLSLMISLLLGSILGAAVLYGFYKF